MNIGKAERKWGSDFWQFWEESPKSEKRQKLSLFSAAFPHWNFLPFAEAERSEAEEKKNRGFENSGQIALEQVVFGQVPKVKNGKNWAFFRRPSPTKILSILPRPSVARPRKKNLGPLKCAQNALKQVVFPMGS